MSKELARDEEDSSETFPKTSRMIFFTFSMLDSGTPACANISVHVHPVTDKTDEGLHG